MQLKYILPGGTYSFDADSVQPSTSTEFVADSPGQPPRSRRDTVACEGWLSGTSQADITSASLALNAALAQPFGDLVFYQDDATVSAIRLYNFGSTSGVHFVAKLNYDDAPKNGSAARGNYVTMRHFSFVAQAEYPLVNAGRAGAGGVAFGGNGPGSGAVVQGSGQGWISDPAPAAPFGSGGSSGGSNLPTGGGGSFGPGGILGQPPGPGSFAGWPLVVNGQLGAGIPGSAAAVLLKFSERLSFSGGGPQLNYLPAINGPWQLQQIYPQLPYRCVQSGSAVGWLAAPFPPPPLWPAALMVSPEFTVDAPQRDGLVYTACSISWKYTFASLTPLTGSPHVWRI